jgi:hypothetical protein
MVCSPASNLYPVQQHLYLNQNETYSFLFDYAACSKEISVVYPSVANATNPSTLVDFARVVTKEPHCASVGDKFWIRNADCENCGELACFTIREVLGTNQFTVTEPLPGSAANCPVCRGGQAVFPREDLADSQFFAEIRPVFNGTRFTPPLVVSMSENSPKAIINNCYSSCNMPVEGQVVDIAGAGISNALVVKVSSKRNPSNCPTDAVRCEVLLSELAANPVTGEPMTINTDLLAAFKLQVLDIDCGPIMASLEAGDSANFQINPCGARPVRKGERDYYKVGVWDLKVRAAGVAGESVDKILYFGDVFVSQSVTGA